MRYTYAEQVADLLQAGRTYSEIAGYTPWQRIAVLYLPRDEHGRIKRKPVDLPDHVEVDSNGMRVVSGKRISLQEAFRRVNLKRGLTPKQVDDAWEEYKLANPKMGRSNRGERRRATTTVPARPRHKV